MDPLVNCPNIVIDDIGNITLEPSVGLYTNSNTSAPQVVDPSFSNPKAARPEKLVEGDSKYDHAPIS
jgi:hypothetical protein